MADASVDTALTGRRPHVRLNGAETVQLAELMERMAVHHALNQPARLQLATLHSPATPLSAVYANRRLGLGDTIEIRDGETATPPLFRGDITGCRMVQQHAQPKRATITALDRLERMNFTRHSRVLRDIADADLFQQLFSRYGLPVTITLSDANTIQPVVTQVRQTDLAFLQLRAGQGDFYFLLQPGGDVRVADYAMGEPAITLEADSELAYFDVSADITSQCSHLRLDGWDAAYGQQLSAEVDPVDVPGAGRTGMALANDIYGGRVYSGDPPPGVSAELTAGRALQQARERARRFVSATGVYTGEHTLAPGMTVDVQGVEAEFAGAYFVISVTHRFDREHGFRTEFQARRPDLTDTRQETDHEHHDRRNRGDGRDASLGSKLERITRDARARIGKVR